MMPLILRGFSALLQRQIEIAADGSTLIPQRNFASANALWEAITGAPALGAQLPYILPHDHGIEGGGAPIPRGCIYALDVGDDNTAITYAFSGITGVTNILDRSDYDFPARVSPGIDSGSTNVSAGTCYLKAYILAEAANNGAQMRISNVTDPQNAQDSSDVNISNTMSWLTISDVYAYGGRWNEFKIQAQETVGANNIYIYALSLHEVRGLSQPESAGAYDYSSVPRP